MNINEKRKKEWDEASDMLFESAAYVAEISDSVDPAKFRTFRDFEEWMDEIEDELMTAWRAFKTMKKNYGAFEDDFPESPYFRDPDVIRKRKEEESI